MVNSIETYSTCLPALTGMAAMLRSLEIQNAQRILALVVAIAILLVLLAVLLVLVAQPLQKLMDAISRVCSGDQRAGHICQA